MKSKVDDVIEKMDLDRTNKVFNQTIEKTGYNGSKPMDDELEVKKARILIAAGNLHVHTAKTAISAIRLSGYRSDMEGIKNAVQKKVRNSRKYAER